LPPFSLESHIDQINSLFDGDSMEEIVHHLKSDRSTFAAEQLNIISKMSPTSLKVTHRQLTTGARLSFKDVFTMEYRLARHFVARDDTDFFEGCRAILIDKDKNPHWKPATLEGVTNDMIDWYFSPLPHDEDLILPSTINGRKVDT